MKTLKTQKKLKKTSNDKETSYTQETVVKMITATSRVSVIPTKMPTQFFMEMEVLNFIWKHKRPRMVKTILNIEIAAGGISSLHSKAYYRDVAIKTAWH